MYRLKEAVISNMHVFNKISIDFSLIGSFPAWFFGGTDTLLIALISMVVLDYITGIIKAIYLKKLSSSIGFKGIIKKFVIFLIVGMSVIIQSIMPETIPIREITMIFFICNEGLSVLENASCMIPLPEKLKSILLQLRKNAGDEYKTKRLQKNRGSVNIDSKSDKNDVNN